MLPFYGGSGGSGGISSLNALTGATQTFVNDTNVTMVSSGTTHTLTWASTLAKARQHASTVYVDAAQTFTAQQIFEVGAAGASPLIARQTGGIAGTDEVQISHNGTDGRVETKSGTLNLQGAVIDCRSIGGASRIAAYASGWTGESYVAAGNIELSATAYRGNQLGLGSGTIVGWASGSTGAATLDTAFARVSAAVIKPTDASTGGGIIEFPQVSAGGTVSSNSARIYAKDVAGTAEIFVKDEGGTETQISPHAMDGAATLYDADDPHPMVIRDVQHYLGGVRYVNVSRMARLLEDLLKAIATGQTLAQIRTFLQNRGAGFIDCYQRETFAQHNARRGTNLQRMDWAIVQAQHQANYDAARAEEIAAHDAWAARPEAERGLEPTVRPEADIRKPKPAWLAARGA